MRRASNVSEMFGLLRGWLDKVTVPLPLAVHIGYTPQRTKPCLLQRLNHPGEAVPGIETSLGRYGVLKVTQLGAVAATAFVFAFGLAAQDKKPEWKDRAEYDLFD